MHSLVCSRKVICILVSNAPALQIEMGRGLMPWNENSIDEKLPKFLLNNNNNKLFTGVFTE